MFLSLVPGEPRVVVTMALNRTTYRGVKSQDSGGGEDSERCANLL